MIKYMRKEEKDQRYIIYKEPSLFLNCNFCCLWLFRLVDFQTRVDAYQSCLCLCAGFERFGGDWRRTIVVMSSALLCLYLLLFLLKLSRFNFIRFLVRNFIQIPSIRAMQQQQPRLCHYIRLATAPLPCPWRSSSFRFFFLSLFLLNGVFFYWTLSNRSRDGARFPICFLLISADRSMHPASSGFSFFFFFLLLLLFYISKRPFSLTNFASFLPPSDETDSRVAGGNERFETFRV